MAREKYSDQHRIFLQGFMCRGILNLQEVIDLYTIARKRCGREGFRKS